MIDDIDLNARDLVNECLGRSPAGVGSNKRERLSYNDLAAIDKRPSLIDAPSVPPLHQILGIKFYGGTSRDAVDEFSRTGGLLVAPAAPSMVNLCGDEEYRRALLASDLAIADNGFMVLLWKFFTGQRVPRISGLEHVKRLLEHASL